MKLFDTTKNEYKARYLFWSQLIYNFVIGFKSDTTKFLDIGCQNGGFKRVLEKSLKIGKNTIKGIDPNKSYQNREKNIELGYAHDTKFSNNSFDFIIFISVFEHIQPSLRMKSVAEIYRILKPKGYLFIQMPNPKFPIEFHTRLPFVGLLDRESQKKYYKKTKGKDIDFWSINLTKALNEYFIKYFKISQIVKYRYPKSVIPNIFKKIYFITRIFPMGQYAILTKKDIMTKTLRLGNNKCNTYYI